MSYAVPKKTKPLINGKKMSMPAYSLTAQTPEVRPIAVPPAKQVKPNLSGLSDTASPKTGRAMTRSIGISVRGAIPKKAIFPLTYGITVR